MNSAVNIHVSRNSSTNYLRLSKMAEVISEYIIIPNWENNVPNRAHNGKKWPDWHVKIAWQTSTQSNEKIQGCVSYMILLRVSNSFTQTILSNNGLPH